MVIGVGVSLKEADYLSRCVGDWASFIPKIFLARRNLVRLIDAAQNEKIPVSAVEEIAYLKKKNPRKII